VLAKIKLKGLAAKPMQERTDKWLDFILAVLSPPMGSLFHHYMWHGRAVVSTEAWCIAQQDRDAELY
jgi:hypothetical protein